MSAIDQYAHTCIGIVQCPSSYNIVFRSDNHNIPIYRLDQDIPEFETEFDGKKGDLILGGGSGEAAALRISIPEAIMFITHDDWVADNYERQDQIVKAFWTVNESFIFCEGYKELGWNPEDVIEIWLTSHIISFVIKNYSDDYSRFIGCLELTEDGSIARVPTQEELTVL